MLSRLFLKTTLEWRTCGVDAIRGLLFIFTLRDWEKYQCQRHESRTCTYLSCLSGFEITITSLLNTDPPCPEHGNKWLLSNANLWQLHYPNPDPKPHSVSERMEKKQSMCKMKVRREYLESNTLSRRKPHLTTAHIENSNDILQERISQYEGTWCRHWLNTSHTHTCARVHSNLARE